MNDSKDISPRYPIRISKWEICGFAATAAKSGQTVEIWTRLALTSDDEVFYKIAKSLSGSVARITEKEGAQISIDDYNSVLLIIRQDMTAYIWVDSADIILKIMAKREINAGSMVRDSQIADILEMRFPKITINPKDKIIYLFRKNWRFGLFFDLSANNENDININHMERTLGTLYRRLSYHEIYNMKDGKTFDYLLKSGWFPFVEILGNDYQSLVNCIETGFDLADTENQLLEKFNEERINHMLSRWLKKPHFNNKKTLLESAIQSFLANQPISTIKIILTEIEGVLNDAHRSVYGRGAKLRKLLEFAKKSAEMKCGATDTLLFPTDFVEYLSTYTFGNFDPIAGSGEARSRHAVGHGAASAESYTKVGALVALLTLDQIAFYT